jgi:CRISPR-associated protein Cas6
MDEGFDVVDVAFALRGTQVAADHGFALRRAVVRHLPWIEDDAAVGIHPLRGALTGNGMLLLPQRAKLVLRVARRRVDPAIALVGQTLDVDGHRLAVGLAVVRELAPWGALYARLVAAGAEDEGDFLARVRRELGALAARCTAICGLRRSIRTAGADIVGFSLMLHELASTDSLRLQGVGLGDARTFGCGLFVPHRLPAPVGST